MLAPALLLVAADLFTRGLAPLDTGAPRELLSAKACSACHDAAHAEWAASRHGRAWTNAIFQREYRQQPLAWCVHCHAPLREQLAEVERAAAVPAATRAVVAGAGSRGRERAAGEGSSTSTATSTSTIRNVNVNVNVNVDVDVDVDDPLGGGAHPAGGGLAAEGVGCASCHLRGRRMLAARKRPGSPHDTDARADFGGPAFCAGCHQFNFPIVETSREKRDGAPFAGRVVGYSEHPMQNTVAEHARGPRAATPCRDCHAAAEAGTHAYPGGHDPAMLARALSLAACRDGKALQLTLTNVGAGHNVPTGDLHRHLALRAWRPSAPERLHETLLGRHFEPAEGGGKRTVSDTTLPPASTRVVRVPVADLGPAAAREPLRVELRLVYTVDEFPLRGRELAEPTYATIASRTLDWRRLEGCDPARRR